MIRKVPLGATVCGVALIAGAAGYLYNQNSQRAQDGAAEAPKREASLPGQSIQNVALPELSRLAETVRRQILEINAVLERKMKGPARQRAEMADAYGEVGKILMAAVGSAAEPYLLNAQILAPEDMRWPYYLGQLYMGKGGQNAKAIPAFQRVLELRADDVPTLIWLGETYLAEGQMDLASSMFAKAQSLDTRSASALAGLGRVRLERRDYAGALNYLKQAASLDQKAGVIRYALAIAYRGLGDVASAEKQLSLGIEGDVLLPDPLMQDLRNTLHSATAYEALGVQALAREDYAGAATYFRSGLVLDPDSSSLHHRLGTALFLGGDMRSGREEFEEALRLAPDFARAHYSLGVLMLSQGQVREALERLSAAIGYDPDYPEARILLADLLRDTGRPRETLAHYERVIRSSPQLAEARLGYALALIALQQDRQAREQLAQASRDHPSRLDLVHVLARLLAASSDAAVRDGDRAAAMMRALLERRPPTPELEEAMAMAYAATGDFQRAVEWQRRAIASVEKDGRGLLQKAMEANLNLFMRGEQSRTSWIPAMVP
jgi:tetratricopeptide (TPR) repeat protein